MMDVVTVRQNMILIEVVTVTDIYTPSYHIIDSRNDGIYSGRLRQVTNCSAGLIAHGKQHEIHYYSVQLITVWLI